MEILKFAIEGILKETYLRHKDLKNACRTAVGLIGKQQQEHTIDVDAQHYYGTIFQDEIVLWKPFYLAYKTKISRIIVVALNGLQKLLAHCIILGRQLIISNKTILKNNGERESKRIVLRLVDEDR